MKTGGPLMSRISRFIPLMALLLVSVGCAHNYYNIPQESYEKKVRIIGVAPIFVDGDSDIRYPEKEPLLALIRNQNRKSEQELVGLLRDTGVYLAVRMPEAQADDLFSSLFFRRERRMDAGVTYNKYFFKQQELKDFIQKNQLDALMVVVVSGLTRPEKIYSSNLMSFLETDYNFLIITAQILDADGNILWEYPNFQKQMLSLPPLFNLQYPDFDEAAANLTDKVDVKFKTIPGITRAFDQTKSSDFKDNVKVSRLYNAVFDDMVSMLKRKFRFFWETSEPAAVVQQRSEPVMASPPPSAQPAMSAPAAPAKAEPAAVVTEPVPVAPGEIKTEDLQPTTK
jgi:hypothetical protein